MNFSKIEELYPNSFSLKMEALRLLAVFIGGLAGMSNVADNAIVPTLAWELFALIICVITTIIYIRRIIGGFEEFEMYGSSWLIWVHMLIPVVFMATIAGLLCLAGGMSGPEVLYFCAGVIYIVMIGPLLTILAQLSFFVSLFVIERSTD